MSELIKVYVVTATGGYGAGGGASVPPRVFSNLEAVGNYIRQLLLDDAKEGDPLDFLSYNVYRLAVEDTYTDKHPMGTDAPKDAEG